MREKVKLRTPHSSQAGQTLTVTLTVQAHDSPDANYAVLYLLVLQEVGDKYIENILYTPKYNIL